MKKLRLIILTIVALFVTPVSAFAATLSLSPSSGTFNRGCAFSLDVKLDTAGVQTDGTDAIIMYDQSRFLATSVTSGTIYADYPGNNIDEIKGVITTSGLASISSPFSGTGTLATINFTVKDTAATGATQISFDFNPADKAKTTDSNVVQRGGATADVLSAVTNGSYTIGTGACGAGATPVVLPGTGRGSTGAASGSAAVQPNNLDQVVGGSTGTSEFTFTIAIVGSVLTVLGVLGLALL
jgi:hypothetical protein